MSARVEPVERQPATDLRRRLLLVLAGLGLLVFVYAIIYRWAVLRYAGESRSLVTAIQIILEALTTGSFGTDASLLRDHEQLRTFIILINVTRVGLIFLALPVLAVPLFKRTFDTQPPRETELQDHVVFCGTVVVDDALRAELDEAGIPYLFVRPDAEEVNELRADGFEATYGNAERVETLRNANFGNARAIVTDMGDERNLTVILAANRVNPDATIVSVVESRDTVAHHEYAGADVVVLSKQSLGESLAMRSIQTIAERFQAAVGLTTQIDFGEYLVEDGSELVGTTIGEIGVADELEITVIGGWFGPRFLVSPPPETEILENSHLLVSGDHEALETVGARKLPTHRGQSSRVVVCGYGDVGQTVANTLEGEGIDVTTVDFHVDTGADVIGDITDDHTIREANVADARSVILAVEKDATAIYSAILISHHAPDVEIIARANDPDNVWKLYNAGADYVLSIPAVTDGVLASALIEDRELLTPHSEFVFVREAAPALVGQRLDDLPLRNQTGCTLVGVERDDELITNPGPEFTIEPEDILVAAGREAAVERFRSLAGKEP
jgi:Trk K+ transport system NAD-binding subunit